MKKYKILDIVFENRIKDFEIEAFRGAVSRIIGFEYTMFHNHISDTKLAYSYPLVQYKTRKGQASFSCIAQGVEEAKFFFEKKEWEFNMTGRTVKLKIDTFQLRNAYFDYTDKIYVYHIKKWQPLNQDNIKKFNSLNTIEEKIGFLESIMIGNILSMAKSLDWKIESKIELSILEIKDQKMEKFKKNAVLTFDLVFNSNMLLPIQIGLGKAVSHGFGVIEKREELN